jgi:hypothetical protein
MNPRISLYALLFLLICAPVVVAQADDEEAKPEMSLWRGGNVDLAFRLGFNSSNTFGSSGYGGLLSPRIRSGAAAATGNPAELASLRTRDFIFDGSLMPVLKRGSFLSNEVSTILDEEVSGTMDEILDDPEQINFLPGGYRSHTQFRGVSGGVRPAFPSMSMAIPLGSRATLAFATHQPINAEFSMLATGINAQIAQEQGSDDVSIRFDVLMNISIATRMTLNMNAFTTALGVSVLKDSRFGDLDMGLSLSRYQMTSFRNLEADFTGMVVVSRADERFFNNPDDPNLDFENGETNALFMRARGNYKDTQNGYSIGMTYRAPILRWVTLSALYTSMPTFTLTDPNAFGDAYLPVFAIGDDVLGGDLKVQLDTLQAAKPNLTTRRDINQLIDDMTVQLPSSMAIGADVALGRHTLTLNYTKYSGELSMMFGENYLGKESAHGLGFGMDFQMKDRFTPMSLLLIPFRLVYLDFDGFLFQALRGVSGYRDPHYRFGASVMLGDGLHDNPDSDMKTTLGMPIPTGLSMTRTYMIGKNVKMGFSTITFPDLLFKYSVSVGF